MEVYFLDVELMRPWGFSDLCRSSTGCFIKIESRMLTNKVMVFVLHLSQLAEVMVLCRKTVGQVVGRQYPLKTSGSDGLASLVGKHILFDIVDPRY